MAAAAFCLSGIVNLEFVDAVDIVDPVDHVDHVDPVDGVDYVECDSVKVLFIFGSCSVGAYFVEAFRKSAFFFKFFGLCFELPLQ